MSFMPARDGAVTSALGRGEGPEGLPRSPPRVLSRPSPRPPSGARRPRVSRAVTSGQHLPAQGGLRGRRRLPSLVLCVTGDSSQAPWLPGWSAGRRGEGRGFLPCLLAVFTGRDRDLSVTPAASVAPGRAPALVLTGWFRRWVLTTPVPRPAAPNVWVASPRPDGMRPGRLPTSPAPSGSFSLLSSLC